LTRVGLYRIDVLPDQQSTSVTVREGEAVVTLANGAAGAAGTNGDRYRCLIRRPPMLSTGQARTDSTREREPRPSLRSSARQRVCLPRMVGAADLDQYGTWQSTPDYGPVWYPLRSPPAGLPTKRVLGERRRLGPDLGRRGAGAMRRSIMGGGRGSAVAGAGARAPTSRVRSGRLQWSGG
jgi:hypothetical protein